MTLASHIDADDRIYIIDHWCGKIALSVRFEQFLE